MGRIGHGHRKGSAQRNPWQVRTECRPGRREAVRRAHRDTRWQGAEAQSHLMFAVRCLQCICPRENLADGNAVADVRQELTIIRGLDDAIVKYGGLRKHIIQAPWIARNIDLNRIVLLLIGIGNDFPITSDTDKLIGCRRTFRADQAQFARDDGRVRGPVNTDRDVTVLVVDREPCDRFCNGAAIVKTDVPRRRAAQRTHKS